MSKKIVGIFVMMLMVATAVLPLVNSLNENKGNIKTDHIDEEKISSIRDDTCGCFLIDSLNIQPDHVLPVGDCDNLVPPTESDNHPRTLLLNWIANHYNGVQGSKDCDEDTDNQYWAHSFCFVESGICPHTKIESAIFEITLRNDGYNDHLKLGCLSGITDTWDFNKRLNVPPCNIPVGQIGTITIDLGTIPGLLDDMNGLCGNLDVAVDDDSPVDCATLFIECEECDPSIELKKTVKDPSTGQWVEHINAEYEDKVWFKLEICNNGNDDIARIGNVYDVMPKCFEYITGSAVPAETYYDSTSSNHNILCWCDFLPIFSSGDCYEIIFQVKITCQVINQETFTNYAEASFWACELNEASLVDTAEVTLGATADPDLWTIGSLSWSGVDPDSMVTGGFQVMNIGENESLLSWDIAEYPEWGTWSFNPSSGRSLKPEDEPVEVKVEVETPDEKDSNFTGDVKIVNMDDPSDYCTIPVSLSTPENTWLNLPPLLQWLREYCPFLFQVLQELLGL